MSSKLWCFRRCGLCETNSERAALAEMGLNAHVQNSRHTWPCVCCSHSSRVSMHGFTYTSCRMCDTVPLSHHSRARTCVYMHCSDEKTKLQVRVSRYKRHCCMLQMSLMSTELLIKSSTWGQGCRKPQIHDTSTKFIYQVHMAYTTECLGYSCIFYHSSSLHIMPNVSWMAVAGRKQKTHVVKAIPPHLLHLNSELTKDACCHKRGRFPHQHSMSECGRGSLKAAAGLPRPCSPGSTARSQ